MARDKVYKLLGRYNGGPQQVVDSFDTIDAANAALLTYKQSLGMGWTLWVVSSPERILQ